MYTLFKSAFSEVDFSKSKNVVEEKTLYMRMYLSRLEDSADNRDVTGSIPVIRTINKNFDF